MTDDIVARLEGAIVQANNHQLLCDAKNEIARLREKLADAALILTVLEEAAAEITHLRRAAPEWRDIAGVPRDELPGTLIGWCVGTKDHSGATWRREGAAVLTLANDGPLGFSARSIAFACWLLDMDAVDEVTMYRRMPSPPSEQAAAVAGEDLAKA